MIETVLTVLAVGVSAICLFVVLSIGYVWILFREQMKEIRKEIELKSHHGEGN